ncbi:MAG TPA: hypothetical protein VKZ50_10800 [bacterium]|nr:hypothetical protein [bacterium]
MNRVRPTVAQAGGRSRAGVEWLLRQDGRTATVIGPRTPQPLQASVDAVDVALDHAILNDVDAIVPPDSAFADVRDTSGWYVGPLTDAG